MLATQGWVQIPEPSFRHTHQLSAEGQWLVQGGECTPLSTFLCLWTQEFNEWLCTCTNNHWQGKGWPLVESKELYYFLGQQLIMGMIILPKISDYWRQENPILAQGYFPRRLTRDRWQWLHTHISFDPIEIGERLSTLYRAARKPSPPIIIDETRFRFQGRFKAIIINPRKPKRFAIELTTCCDSQGYMIDFVLRSSRCGYDRQTAVLTMLHRTIATPHGYEVIGDAAFGGLPLAYRLATEGYHFTFSCSKTRPTTLFRDVLHFQLEHDQTVAFKQGAIFATVTYSRKKVNLLTNAFSSRTRGAGHGYKPQAILEHYDANKGQVDQFNKLLSQHLFDRRHRKWTEAYFSGLLKMTTVNSWKLYHGLGGAPMHYTDYLLALAQGLTQQAEAK